MSDLSNDQILEYLRKLPKQPAPTTPAPHTPKPVKAYSIVQIRRVIEELDAWIDSSQDALDTEEGRDYPNEARLDALSQRIDALTAAKDALEEIE